MSSPDVRPAFAQKPLSMHSTHAGGAQMYILFGLRNNLTTRDLSLIG